jgi:hypothetical protein
MADKKISQLTAASTPVAGTEVFPIVQSGSTVKATIDNLFDRQANYLPVFGANRAATTYGNLHVASTSNAAAFNGGTLSFGGKSVATGNQYVFGGFKFMSDPASGTGWDTYATMSLTNADSSVSEKFSFKNNGNFTALSGNIVIGTAGKGIDFSANTAAAGMTSELLDWYEEGDWTPVGNGITYAAGTAGKYTRVGNLVTCTFNVVFPTTANASAAQIQGLPFISGVNSGAAFGGYSSGFNLIVIAANSYLAFVNTAGTAFVVNSTLSTQNVIGSITYQV